jgi:hypothetical protein
VARVSRPDHVEQDHGSLVFRHSLLIALMPTASTSQIEKMYESAAGLKTKNMDVSQTENNEDICWRLLFTTT